MSSSSPGLFGGLIGSARKWLSPGAAQAPSRAVVDLPPPQSAEPTSAASDGLVAYKGRQLKDMPISRLRKALADFGHSPSDAALRSELVSRLATCITLAASPVPAGAPAAVAPPTRPAPLSLLSPSNKRKAPEKAVSPPTASAVPPNLADDAGEPLPPLPPTSAHALMPVLCAVSTRPAKRMVQEIDSGGRASFSSSVALTRFVMAVCKSRCRCLRCSHFHAPPCSSTDHQQPQGANVVQAPTTARAAHRPLPSMYGGGVHVPRPTPVVQLAEEPSRLANSSMTLRILETLEKMSRPLNVRAHTTIQSLCASACSITTLLFIGSVAEQGVEGGPIAAGAALTRP